MTRPHRSRRGSGPRRPIGSVGSRSLPRRTGCYRSNPLVQVPRDPDHASSGRDSHTGGRPRRRLRSGSDDGAIPRHLSSTYCAVRSSRLLHRRPSAKLSCAVLSGRAPEECGVGLRVGDTFLGFQLVEELGQGAFARVFLARQESLAGRPGRAQGDAPADHARPNGSRASSTPTSSRSTRSTTRRRCRSSACRTSAGARWPT